MSFQSAAAASPPPHRVSHATSANGILAKIPSDELAIIMEHAEEIAVSVGTQFFDVGDTIRRVYFPLSGMASVVTVLRGGISIEAMTIGREGFLGISVMNDVSTAGFRGVCQIAGEFLALDAAEFMRLLARLPELRRRLHRYSQFLQEVVAQSAACDSLHNIEQRCARWILASTSAVGSDTFSITHEALAQVLAVRRAGVTVAIGALTDAGLIGHQRGMVTVLERDGLLRAACECYATILRKETELLA